MSEPALIARYELINRIGQGGMGTLYLARDPAIERLVAIKLLKEGLESSELRERFTREARSAGRLRHPNIVTIFDVGEHEGRPFIAMEYIPGETLSELIRRGGPIPLVRKLEIVDSICQGLAYAHKSGIVHRDIKPANVMVDAEGVVKILDFGIARVDKSEVTRHGMVIGSLNYMSPEQMSGARIDHRTDVFALGAVFYELICYRQAFPGGLSDGILHKVMSGDPAPLTSFVADLDPEIVTCVARTLKKDPDQRYQDVSALRKDVVRVRLRLEGETGEATVRIVPSDSTAGKSPRRTAERELLVQQRTLKIQEMLDAARASFSSGDYENARASCVQALMLDPDHDTALDLMERARTALNDAQKHDLLARARQELEAGSLTLAAQLTDEADGIVPGAADVAAMRTAVEAARKKINEARQREQLVATALERARTGLADGALEVALRAADEALGVEATNVEAAALKKKILTALDERRRHEHDQRARATVDGARRAFAAGDHAAAIERLTAFAPPHDMVTVALRELRTEADHIKRRTQALTKLSNARAAMKARRFSEALSALSEARAIDPGITGLDELQRDAEASLAAAQEADRRQRLVHDRVAAAQNFLRSHDVGSAGRAIAEALLADPRDAEALRIKAEIDATIRRRQAEARVTAARSAIKAGAFKAAINELEQAGLIDRDTPGLGELRREAETLQAEAQARDQRERQIDTAMADADRFGKAGDLKRAMESIEAVLRLDPRHGAARALEKAVKKAIDERAAEDRRNADIRERERKIAQALKGAEQTPSHEKALSILRHALPLDPQHQALQKLIRERELALAAETAEKQRLHAAEQERKKRAQEVDGHVQAAHDAFARGDFVKARDEASRALEMAPKHAAARQLFAEAVERNQPAVAADAPVENLSTVRFPAPSPPPIVEPPLAPTEIIPAPVVSPPKQPTEASVASVAVPPAPPPVAAPAAPPDVVAKTAPPPPSTGPEPDVRREPVRQEPDPEKPIRRDPVVPPQPRPKPPRPEPPIRPAPAPVGKDAPRGIAQFPAPWPRPQPRTLYIGGAAAAAVLIVGISIYVARGREPELTGPTTTPPPQQTVDPGPPEPPVDNTVKPPAEPPPTLDKGPSPPKVDEAKDPIPTEPVETPESIRAKLDAQLVPIREQAAGEIQRGEFANALTSVSRGLTLSAEDAVLKQALDQIFGDAQKRATGSRESAVKEGAPAKATATFDQAEEQERRAGAQEDRGRKEEAVRLLWQAAALFAKAGREARAAPPPPVNPPVSPPEKNPEKSPEKIDVKPPPPVTPPRPRRDEESIRQTFDQWDSAFESRNVDAVKRVYELDRDQERALRRTFDDLRSYGIEVQDLTIAVAPTGQTAKATARVTRRFEPKAGRSRIDVRTQTFTLEKRGDSWRILRME